MEEVKRSAREKHRPDIAGSGFASPIFRPPNVRVDVRIEAGTASAPRKEATEPMCHGSTDAESKEEARSKQRQKETNEARRDGEKEAKPLTGKVREVVAGVR